MRKIAFIWCCLLTAAIVFAACSSQTGAPAPEIEDTTTPSAGESEDPSASNGEAEQAKEPVTLKMVIWGAPQHVDMYNGLLEQFKHQNSYIDIEVITAPYGEFTEKITSMIASGNPPDIAWWSEDTMTYFADRGFFLPLDDAIAQWDDEWDKNDFYDSTLEAGRWNGTQYLLPFSTPAPVLYYNKTLFDEAGIPYPDDSWTWEDADEAVQAISKGTGADKIYGIDGLKNWQDVLNIIRSYGGNFMNEDRTRSVLNSPESAQALNLLMKWVKSEQATMPGVAAPFEQGKVGMFIGWLSFNARFEGVEGLNYDVAYPPEGPAGKRYRSGFGGLVIMKTTHYQEESLELLKFLTGKEGMKDQSVYFGPPRKSVGLSEEFLNPDTPPHNKKVFIEALQYSSVVEHFPDFTKAHLIVQDEFNLMFAEQQSVEDALRNAEEKVNALFE